MVTEDDCINIVCSTIVNIKRLWSGFGGTTAIIVQFHGGMQQTRLHTDHDDDPEGDTEGDTEGEPEGYVALES